MLEPGGWGIVFMRITGLAPSGKPALVDSVTNQLVGNCIVRNQAL